MQKVTPGIPIKIFQLHTGAIEIISAFLAYFAALPASKIPSSCALLRAGVCKIDDLNTCRVF